MHHVFMLIFDCTEFVVVCNNCKINVFCYDYFEIMKVGTTKCFSFVAFVVLVLLVLIFFVCVQPCVEDSNQFLFDSGPVAHGTEKEG